MLLQVLPPVDEALRDGVARAVEHGRWMFGHTSGSTPGAPGFWRMPLADSPPVDALWIAMAARCAELAGGPLHVLQQYANGHTFGLGGTTHRDDEQPGRYTLLFYPMAEWRPEWQGETIFRTPSGLVAVAPAPGVAVLFDSRIPHEGRAPARCFGGLRVTLAFKLAS